MNARQELAGFSAIARPMAWRGIFAILFGIFAVSGAWGSTRVLAFVFGVYAGLEAFAALMSGLGLRNRSLVILAVIDSLTGAFFVLQPELQLLTFSYVVGAWAMLTGILEMFAAGAFRRSFETKRMQAGAGAVSIALGFGLGIYPELSPASLAGWLGATMLLFGCLSVLAAARVRFGRPSVISA